MKKHNCFWHYKPYYSRTLKNKEGVVFVREYLKCEICGNKSTRNSNDKKLVEKLFEARYEQKT